MISWQWFLPRLGTDNDSFGGGWPSHLTVATGAGRLTMYVRALLPVDFKWLLDRFYVRM